MQHSLEYARFMRRTHHRLFQSLQSFVPSPSLVQIQTRTRVSVLILDQSVAWEIMIDTHHRTRHFLTYTPNFPRHHHLPLLHRCVSIHQCLCLGTQLRIVVGSFHCRRAHGPFQAEASSSNPCNFSLHHASLDFCNTVCILTYDVSCYLLDFDVR